MKEVFSMYEVGRVRSGRRDIGQVKDGLLADPKADAGATSRPGNAFRGSRVAASCGILCREKLKVSLCEVCRAWWIVSNIVGETSTLIG